MKKLLIMLSVLCLLGSCSKENIEPNRSSVIAPLTVSGFVSGGSVGTLQDVVESVYINGIIKNQLSFSGNTLSLTGITQFIDTVKIGDTVLYQIVFSNPYSQTLYNGQPNNDYYNYQYSIGTTISLKSGYEILSENSGTGSPTLSTKYIMH